MLLAKQNNFWKVFFFFIYTIFLQNNLAYYNQKCILGKLKTNMFIKYAIFETFGGLLNTGWLQKMWWNNFF